MPTQRIASRIAEIAPSATLAVDAKAKALKAQGESVIGFGAGEPDFPTPEHIVLAAQEACADPRYHKYSPAAGLPELREAIALKTLRDSSVEVDPSQVLVTNGGKHAVFASCVTILDEGDELLLPAPYWTTYPETVALAGAKTVVLPTHEATGFQVTVEQLEAARTERTKALMFVSPSNPTGAVYDRDSIKAIGEWAVEHGIWVITDEIYEHLTYGDKKFYSILNLVPELADTCVILNGVAKTYSMTGWRVGWMIGPNDVIKAATNLQSHSTSNVCNVAQAAALAAVTGSLDAVNEMKAVFDRRRQVIHKMINTIPGVSCLEPEGAFYAFANFTAILDKDFNGVRPKTTLELADAVLDQAKVAFVPGEAFGSPGYGRFSFAMADADMEEGVRRLHQFVESGS
jgi:aspartate/methionine/tyrosine aminotransferase